MYTLPVGFHLSLANGRHRKDNEGKEQGRSYSTPLLLVAFWLSSVGPAISLVLASPRQSCQSFRVLVGPWSGTLRTSFPPFILPAFLLWVSAQSPTWLPKLFLLLCYHNSVYINSLFKKLGVVSFLFLTPHPSWIWLIQAAMIMPLLSKSKECWETLLAGPEQVLKMLSFPGSVGRNNEFSRESTLLGEWTFQQCLTWADGWCVQGKLHHLAAVERTQEESEEGGQMGGGVLSLEAAWTPLTARFCSTPKKKK